MSPIGRVFIVLNAVLAGAFVYFAGVYLQKSTDYKKNWETSQAEHKKEQDARAKDKESLTAEINRAQRDLQTVNQKASMLETQLGDKTRDLETLTAQTNTNNATLDGYKTTLATIATAFDGVRADAEAGRKLWADADAKRNEAVKTMEKLQGDLGGRDQKIAGLERDLAAANDKVKNLAQESEGQKVLIAIAKNKLPGIFAYAAPTLEGQVSVVSSLGDYLTAQITNNPSNAKIEPGYSLAVYANGKYKAEATITDVKDNGVVFATVKHKIDGASINVGDRVSTNPGGL